MKQFYLFSIGASVIAVLGIIGVFFGTARFSQCRDFHEGTITGGTEPLNVAVAATHIEKTHGLSGCRRLPADSGMYFVYDEPSLPQFWMKDMLVPLDIIWVAQGRIIGIEANVPPPASPEIADLPRYRPPAPITGVLELPAGSAATLGLTPGTALTLVQ